MNGIWNTSTAGNNVREMGNWIDATLGEWVLDLASNMLGYATIVVPGYLFIRYYKCSRFCPARSTLYEKFVTLFVFGWTNPNLDTDPHSDGKQPANSFSRVWSRKYARLCLYAFCFLGLLLSHLIWGFYQEKMMTRDYDTYSSDTNFSPGDFDDVPVVISERFRNSQFIVFLNRLASSTLALSYIFLSHFWRRSKMVPFEHPAPFYKYSFASLSNILSSWCQYEALKYVTFPTQVLGKASKIIPTMLVGRVFYHRTYPWHQYVSSAALSGGVFVFLLSRASMDTEGTSSDTTTISGVILLCGYLLFDSFTSNWQSNLFKTYRVGKMQMMCGINLFSCVFTLIPLLEQGTMLKSIDFMSRHPDFCFDCIITSLCAALGQVFIFFTISECGPVAFAIAMTVRQAFAILLSCLYYGHQVSAFGIFGLCMVFSALFVGQYLNSYWPSEESKNRGTG